MQISRDCQELEPSIGEQLASLLYLEPDGELMVCLLCSFWLKNHKILKYIPITKYRLHRKQATNKMKFEEVDYGSFRIYHCVIVWDNLAGFPKYFFF